MLYALGRWAAGRCDRVPYAEAERPLRNQLREFGPPRRSYHPEFPLLHHTRFDRGAFTVLAEGCGCRSPTT